MGANILNGATTITNVVVPFESSDALPDTWSSDWAEGYTRTITYQS